jgi:hypothetical protein
METRPSFEAERLGSQANPFTPHANRDAFLRIPRAKHAREGTVRLTIALLLVSSCHRPRAAPLAQRDASAAPGSLTLPTAVLPARTAPPPVPSPSGLIREERDVPVDDIVERWRLEWESPPKPACADDTWATCPCAGFAFGETGDLDLIRSRPGEPDDRFPLSTLFAKVGNEGALDGRPIFPKWPVTDSDRSSASAPPLATLRERAPIKILALSDFDHDGRATEFVLQVAAGPCGHEASVIVGISRTVPRLHAFSTAERAAEPLVLTRPLDWMRVANQVPATLVETSCGDHGSKVEIDEVVRADAKGLHATEKREKCDPTR